MLHGHGCSQHCTSAPQHSFPCAQHPSKHATPNTAGCMAMAARSIARQHPHSTSNPSHSAHSGMRQLSTYPRVRKHSQRPTGAAQAPGRHSPTCKDCNNHTIMPSTAPSRHGLLATLPPPTLRQHSKHTPGAGQPNQQTTLCQPC
jgi:hypothetical protein